MKKLMQIIGIVVLIAAAAIAILYLLKWNNNKAKSYPYGKAISSQAQALLQKGESLEKQGDSLGAKDAYQKILDNYPDAENNLKIQDQISSLNIKMLFSQDITKGSQLYEVGPGDSLQKIAKKFNTTVELIKETNKLSSDLIRPGIKLKIETRVFSILVDKSQNLLTLFADGEIVKVYHVSTGKNNSTPTATFKIVNKLVDPPWYSAKGVVAADSPENVLGTRWMGLDRPGYGIHGTVDPSSIGSQCTEGCVRMYNNEVEELYKIVPVGTEVKIID